MPFPMAACGGLFAGKFTTKMVVPVAARNIISSYTNTFRNPIPDSTGR